MKTSELTGAALDWAVTKAEGFDCEVTSSNWGMNGWTTDWAQGGTIIEREIDAIYRTRISTGVVTWEAVAQGDSECMGYGETPLIAAMRCYVASKLGDEIDVPKELL